MAAASNTPTRWSTRHRSRRRSHRSFQRRLRHPRSLASNEQLARLREAIHECQDFRRASQGCSRHAQGPTVEGDTRYLWGAQRVASGFLALYLKMKNFHWHVSEPHCRDYHLLLDEQGDELFATTDVIAERVRKIGETTLHSIGHMARLQRLSDNDADYVTPLDMLAELREDNARLTARMRETHSVCDGHGDV